MRASSHHRIRVIRGKHRISLSGHEASRVILNASEFIHPADKAALETLKAIPLFTPCLKAFMKTFSEEYFLGLNMAQKIRLGPGQLPKIYSLLPPICQKLGIDEPQFYLEMDPSPNAYTYGDSKVAITVTSGLVEYMEEKELRAVLAHECGHILCRHVLYHTMADMVTKLGESVFGALAAAALPVRLALLYWDRRSELSADRAAALVDGSSDPVVQTMIRLAGGPRSITKDVDVALYAQQGADYKHLNESLWDKVLQGVAVMQQNHPFTAVRTHEILEWCRTEQFTTLVASMGEPHTAACCPSCGHTNQPGWKFCQNCGAHL
jgi:Zn-dependent protease with chaperone function